MAYKKQSYSSAFTIVELLVIIVVIGILTAITIVSYTGIQSKAVAVSLASDLDNASKQLKMYYIDHSIYPTGFDSNYCPTGITDANYCIKTSSGNEFAYQPNTTNYQSYKLYVGNINGTNYGVADNSVPTQTNTGFLNGTESWALDGGTSFTNTITFFMGSAGLHPFGSNPICTKFPFTPNTDSEGSNHSGSGYFEIRILKSRLATVDAAGFKTWLASNNVTVVINN